jgi:uncharacterized membrane protein YeiH
LNPPSAHVLAGRRIGLGLFSANGTQIARQRHARHRRCAVRMTTAVFGGVLRDIVCNEIPRAFSDHRPYAICSFVGRCVLVAAQALMLPAWMALLAAALVATGLRVAAVAWNWRLRAWRATRSP